MSQITLYHAPQTRSSGTLILLEELGADFDLKVVNMRAGAQREPAFLAVNPMGKVPAVLDGDALITEQGAIFIFLADRFPDKRLAPPIGDPLRGPYLRWMVFYGSSFEPAVVDHALKREPGNPGMMPYGDYDRTLAIVVEQVRRGPYMLGETFSAADVLWGTALNWTMMFGVVPELPELKAYVERVTTRPAFVAVTARDAAMVAEHDKAVSQAV